MTPADHAATVREHERFMWGNATTEEKRESSKEFDSALAAIVALAERATELEAELASADRVGTSPWSEKVLREREEAVIRATELEREREDQIRLTGERAALLTRYRQQAERAERERDEWKDSCLRERHALAHERERAIELETALRERDTLIARQLTPLDVAVTHIQIIRRKGDEYTAQERDNVAAIVEQHVTEARQTLFAALGETAPPEGHDG